MSPNPGAVLVFIFPELTMAFDPGSHAPIPKTLPSFGSEDTTHTGVSRLLLLFLLCRFLPLRFTSKCRSALLRFHPRTSPLPQPATPSIQFQNSKDQILPDDSTCMSVVLISTDVKQSCQKEHVRILGTLTRPTHFWFPESSAAGFGTTLELSLTPSSFTLDTEGNRK